MKASQAARRAGETWCARDLQRLNADFTMRRAEQFLNGETGPSAMPGTQNTRGHGPQAALLRIARQGSSDHASFDSPKTYAVIWRVIMQQHLLQPTCMPG